MSSKVNEALYDLIHSMTKSEKRYFKLLSSRHTIGDENNYVTLFDFIDKQEEYDEREIHDEFKGEAFLNRFSITKKRLYDHILSALDAYHVSGSTEPQLYRMLHAADILFEKSLYEQSRRLLRSAEKLALKHEFSQIQLLIIDKQKRLCETTGYASNSDLKIEQLTESENSILNTMRVYNDLWQMKSNLFTRMAQKGIARSPEEIKAYKTICGPLSNVDIAHLNNSETLYLFHHTMSAYYYAIGEAGQSIAHLQKNLQLFESEKGDLIAPNKKISAYTNAIYLSDKLGEHKNAIRFLSQLKLIASKCENNEDLAIKLFSSITSIELSMCLRRGDFSGAYKVAQDVQSKLEMYGDKIVPLRRAFLEFKLAVVYIGMGEFNTALKWINQVLNNSKLDTSEDIIGFAQLLDLLIHIELNNDKLLPYSLKSAQRFFKNRNRLYNFESIFLQFIARLIKCEDRFAAEDQWEELYLNLTEISDEQFDQVALEYFDFKAWAEAKLKRKNFDMVLKEKYSDKIRLAS